jgi:predicted enzyme related to lactoylglutathione lyase
VPGGRISKIDGPPALRDGGVQIVGRQSDFPIDDVDAEFQRLRGLGVRFTQEPLEMGGVTTAVFDDTCGNLIQIAKA